MECNTGWAEFRTALPSRAFRRHQKSRGQGSRQMGFQPYFCYKDAVNARFSPMACLWTTLDPYSRLSPQGEAVLTAFEHPKHHLLETLSHVRPAHRFSSDLTLGEGSRCARVVQLTTVPYSTAFQHATGMRRDSNYYCTQTYTDATSAFMDDSRHSDATLVERQDAGM